MIAVSKSEIFLKDIYLWLWFSKNEETRVALKKVYQKMYQTGSGVLPWKVKITGDKSSLPWIMFTNVV